MSPPRLSASPRSSTAPPRPGPAAFSRRRLLGLAGALAAGVTLAGCRGGAPAVDGRPVLSLGLSSEPATLKAGADQGAAALLVVSLLHRGLVGYDGRGEITPALASEWHSDEDTVFTFTLRPGLTFHDGSPLTSAEAAATLRHLADPANSARVSSALTHLAEVRTPDATTVVVELTEPNAAFLAYLADPSAGMVPAGALSGAPNTVGAGPFRLVAEDNGIGMTLEHFGGYYDAPEVALGGVQIAYYADGTARTNALLSGDVDIIDFVPWENFRTISRRSGYRLAGQSGLVMYLAFNVTRKPFDDPRVRRAVALAVNRDSVVRTVFSGHARPVAGPPVPTVSEYHDTGTADAWAHDPAAARRLLAEAGHPGGFSATLLTTSQYAFHQDTAVSVQSDLERVGIRVTLENPDYATRIQLGNSGDYDLAVNGNGGIVNDPAFLSDFLVGPANYKRSFGYTDERTEELLVEGVRATAAADRKDIYTALQQRIAETVPFAMISDREQAFAHTDRVRGFGNLPGFLTFDSGYTFAGTSLTDQERGR
ncbi:ABC transporter substrate-binding protein [Streptomyces sp. NBUA17]|uniref:ABC transporter substrate-binding protein n=1 Tax=Streptomyces sp. NBUA17 TaxID=3062275 RepID=UPI0037D9FBCC